MKEDGFETAISLLKVSSALLTLTGKIELQIGK